MPEHPLISVIIPVYNAEKYLPQCVDSMLGQTYTNLEVILVDDGSPDNCPQMCDEYASKDNRVKVIHKQSGGASDARNAGVDIAAGEYLAFVDSDDWAEPDMLEFLYRNLAEHGADMSCCFCYLAYNDLNLLLSERYFKEPLVLTGEQAAIKELTEHTSHTAWAKLFKKYIFDEIRFPVGVTGEDVRIIVDLFMAARKVYISPQPKYFYRQRKSGVVRSGGSNAVYIGVGVTKKIIYKLDMYEERQQRIVAIYPNLIKAGEAHLYRRYILSIITVLQTGTLQNTPEGQELISSLLKKIRRYSKLLSANPYLKADEKLALCVINTRLTAIILPYLRISTKLKKKYRSRKNRNCDYSKERILFE